MAFRSAAKPGAQIPRYAKMVAFGDPPPTNIAFRIAVATPGNLDVTYVGSPNNTITLSYPAAGVYIEPGEFASVTGSDGTTIVTVPATTVVFLNK